MWQSTKWVDWNTGARIWRCRNCKNYQTELPAQGLRIPPKILYIDIETALISVDVYDLYIPGKRINKDMINRRRFVINWAAAWVNPQTYEIKKILTGVVTEREAKQQDDKRIVQEIFNLMDEADYLCWHNGDSFDHKILKWRFLFHGMGYPSQSKTVDTFKLSGQGKPESRGLEYISTELGGNRKKGLDADEWRKIVRASTPAEERTKLLRKSSRYCRGDVQEGVHVLKHYVRAIEQSGKIVFR